MATDSTTNNDLHRHRKKMTDEFGAGTLDKGICLFHCTQCGNEIADPSVRTIADASYNDLQSISALTVRLAKSMAKSDLPDCSNCKVRSRLKHYDYHLYHATESRDLVVRATPPKGVFSRWTTESFWWNPEKSYVAIERLDNRQQIELSLSILRRRLEIASIIEDPDIEKIAAIADQLLNTIPGHALLLESASVFVKYGKTSIAGAIADAHIERHPQDAKGYECLGHVIFSVVNNKAMPLEALEEAIEHLNKALQLDPNSVQASISLANCYRLQNRIDKSKSVFQNLLSRDPNCAPAHYNLGIMALESQYPNDALRYFESGANLEPDDADFPMGQARALIMQRDIEKANLAFDRAKELDPDHPMINSLLTDLQSFN